MPTFWISKGKVKEGFNMSAKICLSLDHLSPQWFGLFLTHQFMLRSEALRLYRNMLRLTYKVGDLDQRKHLQQWIRGDFENNRHHKEEEVIRMMISKGKLSLRELEQTIMMVQ